MKELMLGNAAVARGLYEAGCRFVSSYPGTPSTEITEQIAQYDEVYAEWAPNEKVAVEAALGACIAGARSFSAMKHVGLNVAADPLFTSAYVGVNAGFVIGVADDPNMHSSQNEQDSRHYAEAAKIPMLEPSDSSECLEYAKLAFELSEKYDTPVLLRVVTRVAHSQSLVELSPREELELKPYVKNQAKYITTPVHAQKRHPIVESRIEALREFAAVSDVNREELRTPEIGIVTSGTSYQYVREAFPNASVFKLGMAFPLPVERIREFALKVDKLYVIEELDPFIETALRAAGIAIAGGKNLFGLVGEFSQHKIRKDMGAPLPDTKVFCETVPPRPPVLCAGCPHRGVFAVLSKLKLTVFGDIGCYTLGYAPPLNAMDTTVCMGASISMLHGFTKARPETVNRAVGVIGDSTFMHSGMTGLADIVYNKGLSTVLVLDNSITGMTGHQQNPCTGLTLKNEPTYAISIEKVCEALGVNNVHIVDPIDMVQMEKVLKLELEKPEPSVIIARRPCVLLKNVKHKKPVLIDPVRCRGCKACMKLGCPAIRFTDTKASIDETLCVGCGLCVQTCGFNAIEEAEA